MNIIKHVEEQIKKQFEITDEIRDFNQEKVLNAFRNNKIGLEHFSTVSGYGHDDIGREALDKTFADTFKAEKAIVRNHFVSGTHALACCLFGNLRHGEKLVSVVGTPYDTMQEVIGTAGDNETKRASLIGNGVLYDEVPLLNETDIDFEKLEKMVDDTTTMVLIQRSKGYSTRKSLSIETIEQGMFASCKKLETVVLSSALKEIGQNAFVMCKSLETIVLPTGLTTIGQSAFSGCSALKNVYYEKNRLNVNCGRNCLWL